ncbi:MAG TPA: NADH-quinone oxidoreductase subunit N [candidate division Zixibacteria bacterium]|nr:NADH-quinone oxidoreductase subunit N [candidate division Zixibacteria bacterium]
MTDTMLDLFTLLPELILAITILFVLTTDLFLPRRLKWLLTPLTVFGLLMTGVGLVLVWGVNDTVFGGFYRVDDLSVFFKAATVIIGIFSALFAPSYLVARRLPLGEFNTILLTSLAGMFVLASGSDLITLFLGLELMVMPSYLLTGFHKTNRFSNEGGLKYFLLGSFASAILLFGIAWTYGLTGSTRLADIGPDLLGSGPGGLVAVGMMTVGATFKVAAVPFHYWTPDAYQGAPTPITGFLSVGPKLGAFALLVRLFVGGLGDLRADWLTVMALLAVLTMTGGNVVALVQTNVKRMLAYSSIAHTGYIMAGLAAYAAAATPELQQRGIEAILFYVLGYGIMNVAAFAVVGMLQRDPTRYGGLRSFAGLARRSPGLAAAMAILLLSLTGIPPTVGFFAKLYVLLAAVDAGLGWLAVLIALNAALAAFYYLRVIVYMYMRDPEDEPAPIDGHPYNAFALALSVAGVILLGLFPEPVLGLLQVSAASIF